MLNRKILIILFMGLALSSFANSKQSPFLNRETHFSAAPLITQIFKLHYSEAETMEKLLNTQKAHLFSKYGSLIADKKSNQLWVVDKKSNLKKINHIIKKFDQPVPQVLIRTKILSIDDSVMSSLGILFNQDKTGSPEIQSIISLAHILKLNIMLNALEKTGQITVISRPELMTNNNSTAVIESGEEVPYQERSGEGNTSVTFKKAVLRLKVTPHLLSGKIILLDLEINQDKVSELVVNGVPAIQTQQIVTQVSIKDKQTLVLGGIYEQSASHAVEALPFLKKIPLLGKLLQHKEWLKHHKQLLILVRPQVLA